MESVLDVYSDAIVANCVSLKSGSGMGLRIYGNCVFWRSKRQDMIAGDTTEAELIVISGYVLTRVSQQRYQHCGVKNTAWKTLTHGFFYQRLPLIQTCLPPMVTP